MYHTEYAVAHCIVRRSAGAIAIVAEREAAAGGAGAMLRVAGSTVGRASITFHVS